MKGDVRGAHESKFKDLKVISYAFAIAFDTDVYADVDVQERC